MANAVDAPIRTAGGATIPAGGVLPGTPLWGFQRDTGAWGVFAVASAHQTRARCVRMYLDDGRAITASWDHRLCAALGEWVQMAHIVAGAWLDGTTPGRVAWLEDVGTRTVTRIVLVNADAVTVDGITSYAGPEAL